MIFRFESIGQQDYYWCIQHGLETITFDLIFPVIRICPIQHKALFLVEGNFDVMRLHELEIKNVVATCGTALTKEQIALIRRFTYNIILIYDADEAGEKATHKNAELLLAEGMNVRIATLPTGDDPDNFGLKKGKKAIEQLIKDAIP